MAGWDTVRALALSLPEAEEGPTYRKPAYKVRGKTFAWESPHEHGHLVVHVDPDERPLLLETSDAYFVTPHYETYPMLLIRLDAIAEDDLRERLVDSWLLRAPPRLARTLEVD